jgi:cytochrome b subunit of formate dehydrogenase
MKTSPGIGSSGIPVSSGSWNSSAFSAEVGAKSSSVAGVVSFVHLCIGYGVLGQIVARKEP